MKKLTNKSKPITVRVTSVDLEALNKLALYYGAGRSTVIKTLVLREFERLCASGKIENHEEVGDER